jgi:sulfatase modifying factor 1
LTLAASPPFARIPAGEFLMGASDAEADERPVHRVYLQEFHIGRFPVTQDDYARFIRETGHLPPQVRTLPLIASGSDEVFRQHARPYEWRHGEPPAGHAAHPVVLVTYEDAVAYCRWLTGVLGQRVRLPTEAEWEKAARGGAEGQRFPWGNEIDPTRGNFLADAASKPKRGTRATGSYPPNGYGLYDVAGNAWEWVSDWYDRDYYALADPIDPAGPPTGTMRIVRGGSWVNDDVTMLRCAYRHKVPPDTYAYSIGFRIVCSE